MWIHKILSVLACVQLMVFVSVLRSVFRRGAKVHCHSLFFLFKPLSMYPALPQLCGCILLMSVRHVCEVTHSPCIQTTHAFPCADSVKVLFMYINTVAGLRFCVYDGEPFGVSSCMTAAPENGVGLVLTVVSLHSASYECHVPCYWVCRKM